MGGNVTKTDDAFAFVYHALTVPPVGDCTGFGCRFTAEDSTISNGAYWLKGPNNSPTDASIMRVDLESGTITSFNANVNEHYTDYMNDYHGLVFSNSHIWTTISNLSYKPRIVGINSIGQQDIKEEFGSVGDTILNPQALPDGRIAFLDLTESHEDIKSTGSVGIFDPATKAVTLIPISNNGNFLFDLSVGPDGSIWTEEGYENPSLVRINPDTHVVKNYSIGQKDSNLALSLAASSDGKVWYLDYRSNQICILDTSNGNIDRYKPPMPIQGTLHSAGGNVFYVSESSGKDVISLLDVENGSLYAAQVPTLLNTYGQLDGFAVGQDGLLAYESGGDVYLLPPN
ncbi:hypothetical protein GCM10008957_34500 [Deinococcus ruber]|uniref:Uncharacterized protein n=1 Tax=Deinococcus ruber TaxID=1848197 RepID=A0A918CFN9_9DEIO|nr:hypothetical protein GCM10008957_34500 [Deinococcus ruber]